MKTITKMLTTVIKTLLLLLVINMTFSCTNNKTNSPSSDVVSQKVATEEKTNDTIVIKGTVKAIRFGKDGYTADVETDTSGIYAALVSISNVGGPENHKSCEVGNQVTFKGVSSVLADVKQFRVIEIVSIGAIRTQLLISPFAFRGIQVGDLIANHKAYIQKTKLKTGEGTFDVYEIKDFENNPAGYLVPDPKNKLLVGDITVKTPKAETAKGIKVGGTFQDLLKAFPNIEVHGSEIEGQTHANANNISYRLDMPNFTYDVDKAKIPPTTKITEIMINRGEAAKAMISEALFSKIKSDEYCWQTSKTLELRTEPNAKSKVEGKHFAGEVLKVLGTKMINNQLWIKVAYTFKIKAGYEDTFADGQVSPGGEPTGWIGGAETPKISCK